MTKMKIYRVGGCVRDQILGLPEKDIDYVVVGSSEKEMLSLGYERVGVDFPVFLNPETNEEYALARREKKVGAGYNGFEMDTKGESKIIDNERINSLDCNLLQIFLNNGFNLENEYSIDELIQFFQRINQ